MHDLAARLEEELGPEQPMFIEGCQAEWDELPRPDLPLTVGLDGGYIHSSAQTTRKDVWFEVIAGRTVPERRTQLLRLRGVCGQPGRQQADGQKATDALNTPWCRSPIAGPLAGAQRRSARNLPPLVPPVPAGARRSRRSRVAPPLLFGLVEHLAENLSQPLGVGDG